MVTFSLFRPTSRHKNLKLRIKRHQRLRVLKVKQAIKPNKKVQKLLSNKLSVPSVLNTLETSTYLLFVIFLLHGTILSFM